MKMLTRQRSMQIRRKAVHDENYDLNNKQSPTNIKQAKGSGCVMTVVDENNDLTKNFVMARNEEVSEKITVAVKSANVLTVQDKTKKLVNNAVNLIVQAVQEIVQDDHLQRQKSEDLQRKNKNIESVDKEKFEHGNKKLESDKEKLEHDNRKLESDKEKLHHDNRKLESDKEKLHHDNRKLESDKEKIEHDNRKLESDEEKLKQDNRILEHDNRILKYDNKILEQNNTRLEHDNTKLVSNNNKLESDIEKLGHDNRIIEQNNTRLEHDNTKLVSENRKLEHDKGELNKTQVEVQKALKDLVECPICYKVPRTGPVPCCQNGHIICQDCRKRCSQCPTCRSSNLGCISIQTAKVLEMINHLCTFESAGCSFEGPLNVIKNHEKKCRYTTIRCPGGKCSLNFPPNSLMEHFKATGACVKKSRLPHGSDKYRTTRAKSEVKFRPRMFHHLGQAYFLQCEKQDGIWIFYLQTNENPTGCNFMVTVQGKGRSGTDPKWIFNSRNISSLDNKGADEVIKSGADHLVIIGKKMEKLIKKEENSKLRFTVHIKIENQ